MRIALLYEHPTWSNTLIERSRDRGLNLTAIDVAELCAGGTPQIDDQEFDLWVNRVNAMPSQGRQPSLVAAVGHLLLALDMQGQRVVNGSLSHQIGGSKAAQAALFARSGLEAPASIAIYRTEDSLGAADALGYPVLTKPNVGGSGRGIMRHQTAADLEAAIEAETLDLGIDGTGLVQRIIESADGLIHRVEMLGSELFYGTQQPIQAGAFNYCATDGCSLEGAGGSAIQLFLPPEDMVERVGRVMANSSTQVGGVEYIVDNATGKPSFYDFNPFSNFIAGRNEELGFSPIDRYLDFILSAQLD